MILAILYVVLFIALCLFLALAVGSFALLAISIRLLFRSITSPNIKG